MANTDNTNTGLSTSRVPMTLRSNFFQDSFFQNAWDDFERVRQEMLRESQAFWSRAEQDMKQLQDSSAANMMSSSSSSSMVKSSSENKATSQEKTSSTSGAGSSELAPMDSAFSPFFFPRRWMMPLPSLFGGQQSDVTGDDFLSNQMKKLDLFQHEGDQSVIRMKEDDSKFELSLDTHGYRPDEIKVNVHGQTLSVEAKHEEKSDNKFESRQFSRKYTLPTGCEAHKVNSNLSSDGILLITAPKKQAIKQEEQNRPIPIEISK